MVTRTGLGNRTSRSFIKRRISSRQLSFKHGCERNTLVHALDRPFCRAEAIIAKVLGVSGGVRIGVRDTSAAAVGKGLRDERDANCRLEPLMRMVRTRDRIESMPG